MITSDIEKLVEIAAGTRSLLDYERAVFEVIATRVGFDVAMFSRSGGLGAYSPGMDAAQVSALRPHWSRFTEEYQPVVDAALQSRSVAVDAEALGWRQLERTEHYQRLMAPHGGTATALVCLVQRGSPIGVIALGRSGGGFSQAELEHLRAIAPTLSVCDAAVCAAPAPGPRDRARLALLTPREHEVLSYLHLGYTNAQIARALGSASRTVRNQLSSIFAKLEVGSRAEAASLSVHLELTTR
jgi:DNA-binding CsgD family transcriptional regulator